MTIIQARTEQKVTATIVDEIRLKVSFQENVYTCTLVLYFGGFGRPKFPGLKFQWQNYMALYGRATLGRLSIISGKKVLRQLTEKTFQDSHQVLSFCYKLAYSHRTNTFYSSRAWLNCCIYCQKAKKHLQHKFIYRLQKTLCKTSHNQM